MWPAHIIQPCSVCICMGFFFKIFFIDDQELLQIPLNELIELNDIIALALFVTVLSK